LLGVGEAKLEESGAGLAPTGEGWFVVNARDAVWLTTEDFGSTCVFESPQAWFGQLGVRISVLEPGAPNCLYHQESQQEAFLVLAGECRLLVEGEERMLGQWDFFHCPPGTEHVFVGSGDGPCVILMCGARRDDEQLRYPVSELAARYGASVDEDQTDATKAYAPYPPPAFTRPPGWGRLPWT
jgi:uncharacterized cupin superfamily protein